MGGLPAPGRRYLFAARDRCGDAEDRIRSIRGERLKYIRNFRPELPHMQTSIYKEMAYPVVHVLRSLYRRWLAARGLPEDADSDALIAWWMQHYE